MNLAYNPKLYEELSENKFAAMHILKSNGKTEYNEPTNALKQLATGQ
jgi:hypothetical protein